MHEDETDRILDKAYEVLERIKSRIDTAYTYEDIIDTALENTNIYRLDSSFGDAVLKSVAEAAAQVLEDALKEAGIKVSVIAQESKRKYHYGEYEIKMKSPYLKEDGDVYDMVDKVIDLAQRGFILEQFSRPDDEQLASVKMQGSDKFIQRIAKDSGLSENAIYQNADIQGNKIFDSIEMYLKIKKDASLDIEIQCKTTVEDKETTISETVKNIEKYDAKIYDALLDAIDEQTYRVPDTLKANIDSFWDTYRANNTACKENTQKRDDIER